MDKKDKRFILFMVMISGIVSVVSLIMIIYNNSNKL